MNINNELESFERDRQAIKKRISDTPIEWIHNILDKMAIDGYLEDSEHKGFDYSSWESSLYIRRYIPNMISFRGNHSSGVIDFTIFKFKSGYSVKEGGVLAVRYKRKNGDSYTYRINYDETFFKRMRTLKSFIKARYPTVDDYLSNDKGVWGSRYNGG